MSGIKDIRLTITLADGRQFEDLPIKNHALVQWDRTRQRNGWPQMEDAKFLWTTFCAWQTLVDMDEYPELMDNPKNPKGHRVSSFQQFENVDCAFIDPGQVTDPEDVPDVDPTQLAAGPDSSLPSQPEQVSAPSG